MRIPTSDLTESVTVTRKTGDSAYGPVYGDTDDVKCALEWGFRKVTNTNGEEVIASAVGFFRDDTTLKPGDEIIHKTRRYRVIDVQPIMDRKTVHHQEVYLQSMGEA